jgi:hypothetical protein
MTPQSCCSMALAAASLRMVRDSTRPNEADRRSHSKRHRLDGAEGSMGALLCCACGAWFAESDFACRCSHCMTSGAYKLARYLASGGEWLTRL